MSFLQILGGAGAGAILGYVVGQILHNGSSSGNSNSSETEMLNREIDHLKQTVAKRDEQIAKMRKTADEFSTHSKEDNEEIDELERQVDKLEKKNKTLENELDNCHDTIDKLKGELYEKGSIIEQYKAELDK